MQSRNGRFAERGKSRHHMAYDQGGIKGPKPKPRGGRKCENMTLAEAKALLAQFANAAGTNKCAFWDKFAAG